MNRRYVSAAKIAYWKAADFLGSGAYCYKKLGVCYVALWTQDHDGKKMLDVFGAAPTWDAALSQARQRVDEMRRRA